MSSEISRIVFQGIESREKKRRKPINFIYWERYLLRIMFIVFKNLPISYSHYYFSSLKILLTLLVLICHFVIFNWMFQQFKYIYFFLTSRKKFILVKINVCECGDLIWRKVENRNNKTPSRWLNEIGILCMVIIKVKQKEIFMISFLLSNNPTFLQGFLNRIHRIFYSQKVIMRLNKVSNLK